MAETIFQNDPQTHGHHLLVCLDGSVSSEASLPYVLGMAKTFKSAITLVEVMEPARFPHADARTNDVLSWEITRQEARAYLERVQKDASEAFGESVETRLEQGPPAQRIVDLARELGADLVVLSSHGEGGDMHANLGSTALQVLAIARSSVFIVHASSGAANVLPRRVLVPLDGSPRTESVLPAAARIARAYGAELLLVHVVREPLPTLVLNAPNDIALTHELAGHLERSGNRYLEDLRDRLAHERTSVSTLVVRHASERQALLDVCRDQQVDLIVLSARGSVCDPSHAFGGVTTDLLLHARLPILVLQDLPEQEASPEGHRSPAPALRASFAPEAE